MQQVTFNHLINSIDFRANDKAVTDTLKLIYVDGMERSDAVAQTGVSNSTFGKAKDRFKETLEQYRRNNGLLWSDYFLSKAIATLVKWLEQRDLHSINTNTIDPAKKQAIDEAAEQLISLLLPPSK